MRQTESTRMAFFASSLVSAYWNGAATYYRGIIRALDALGYHITFYEPDALDRQAHRDIEDPEWARVVVYDASSEAKVRQTVQRAASACDVLVKASGVGVHDTLLEREVLRHQTDERLVIFWDVDAPATLERAGADRDDPFRSLVPKYDMVLTYGGGPPVIEAYESLGARRCVPVYNAHDPAVHQPAPSDPKFQADLAFLGNRLPDREARVDAFFSSPARAMPNAQFIIGGSGWEDKRWPPNVRALGHVYTADHNAFNATPRAVLNIARDSMARFGYSPATRVFEAAAAGACIITDAWKGIDFFFEPDRELLVAESGDEVVRLLTSLSAEAAAAVGAAARRRALADHTYDDRARLVDEVLTACRHGRMASARAKEGVGT